MATHGKDNVDYRLLERLNMLVICSRCLRRGRVTPIPQLISPFHRPRSMCGKCRAETATGASAGRSSHRHTLAKVVQLRH